MVDQDRLHFEVAGSRRGGRKMFRFGFRMAALKYPFHIKKIVGSVFLAAAVSSPALAANLPDTKDDVQSLIKQAAKETRKGLVSDAEKLLRQALVIDPNHAGAKTELAFVLAKQRKFVEAYNLSFAVAKADPTNARAFAVLGYALLYAGRFSDAKMVLINAIQLNKREDLAWAGYGMLAFYENRMSESIDNLRESVYLEPNEPDYWFSLAQVSARSEHYKEAADAYDRFLSVSGKTDEERRARIKGLVNFLRYLGQKQALYVTGGDNQTTMPIKLVGNRPIIQISVNDFKEPLNFVLDTGSGISVISDKTAARLGVKPITRGGFAKGLGGDGKFEIVYGFLRHVRLGAVDVRNVPVYIRQFHSDSEAIDGYIGLSLISKFLTTLDYGELTFSLLKKDAGDTEGVDSLSLPLRLTSSGFLSGEVQLEGVQNSLNFIVDTGASVSVISDEVASLGEVKNYIKGEKMRVIGSAGVTDEVPSLVLPRVSFGKHSRSSIAAIALDLDMINEASGFEQAGILGGNFLKNYRLTFDFKNSKVTFFPLTPDK
jgi:tetratricopeptide (TPR) repeat protein/predicted aspartyl protease